MASQLLLPILLLIFLQAHKTYAHRDKSNTHYMTSSLLEFLDNLNGTLEKGDNVKGVQTLKKHLLYLGYLNPDEYRDDDIFDDPLESATKKYQKFFSLNVTGVLDATTVSSIKRPRCGVPDFFLVPRTNATHLKSLYAFIKGNPKWKTTKLKFYISGNVPRAMHRPIEQAFWQWQDASRTFQFTPVRNYFFNKADIKVSFERGDHGDGNPFFPNGLRLAHSFPPPDGRIHFNMDQRWASNGDKSAYDLTTVALHELGHALGLNHTDVQAAVMYPQILKGQRRSLHPDDIKGIKALYGS